MSGERQKVGVKRPDPTARSSCGCSIDATRTSAWFHTVREEFATYHPVADLLRWLGGDPFVQIGRHAVVNLQAIERVIHYGDRLYRVRLRDRASTEVTASRTGAARLAAVLKTQH